MLILLTVTAILISFPFQLSLCQEYECGGLIQKASGLLDYKLGTPFLPGESCVWILKPNNVSRESKMTLQLEQDGFIRNLARLTIFAMTEAGDLETLSRIYNSDRTTYTFTAHVFLIRFESSDTLQTFNGTGFRLAFNTVEVLPSNSSLAVKSIFARPELDNNKDPQAAPIWCNFPPDGQGYKPNEVWLMVFHHPYKGQVSFQTTSAIEIGQQCNQSKFLAFYTGDYDPLVVRRICHAEPPTGFAFGSSPFIMTFRSGPTLRGNGFQYFTAAFRYN